MGKNKCKRISPLTGREPRYEPNKYNDMNRIRGSHNCFAYAFDYMDIPSEDECTDKKCNINFHQPGIKSGFPKWNKTRGKRCPDLLSRLRGDVHGIQRAEFTERCPPQSSKIALVVSPENDYHFFRQDSNGLWSHKPGALPVTNLDADNRPIYDPALANRHYQSAVNDIDYNQFCTYLCVPKGGRPFKFKRGGCGRRQTQRKKGKSVKLTRKARTCMSKRNV